ncbi:metal-dependent phosphohydrolase [Rhodoferax antarcticus ANT.BR]|uniref:Metal-dependent phosphohydrolase n=2 Tax=Rhodoferax antarcticus TaxID=81479 RepID=A0A1Q8YA61_9BURK|nr:metal-dependent phosphohydrolase [Rhodoferax antarcticus ANT.BR]
MRSAIHRYPLSSDVRSEEIVKLSLAAPLPHSGMAPVLSFQPIIDALSANIALLDGDGVIRGVNQAWMQFADANNSHLRNYGLGSNYLAPLVGIKPNDNRSEKGAQDLSFAGLVAGGLRNVLSNAVDKFQIEYPCNSPTDKRWYLLTITPFPGAGLLRAVVAHEDISALKLSEAKVLEESLQLSRAFSDTIAAIAMFIEKRDPYTAGHQLKVSALCVAIGQRLGLGAERLNGLRLGASIHDIGKMSVPAEILSRPGHLLAPELELIKYHCETGYDILRGIDFPWPIAEMVYQHHERLDGSGYPRHLKGAEISLEARIIAVADVFDAISSHRPYRAAKGQKEAIAELERGRDRWYDGAVVDALFAILQESDKHEGIPKPNRTP